MVMLSLTMRTPAHAVVLGDGRVQFIISWHALHVCDRGGVYLMASVNRAVLRPAVCKHTALVLTGTVRPNAYV